MRLAWFYVPNGIDMRHWTPADEGPLGDAAGILAPLEPVKNDLLVLSNLTANWGRPLLVGAGDHGRALAAYMTGVQVYRTAGADLKLGVSADQIAAAAIGNQTKLPSLEVGLEEARQAGNCDNGYSCAYTYNLSWKTETQPLPPDLRSAQSVRAAVRHRHRGIARRARAPRSRCGRASSTA